MASPYDGLAEPDLIAIKSYLLQILTGKIAVSTSVPGIASSWRVASLEEARMELVLVNAAINALDPDARPSTRTQGTHSTYQFK